ncbi:barstar family protein [Pectobacterium sp. B1J-3]|uniref:barstar family protein n=1 Tax=Pectobacterium sp. B1J-3 TaxID=3385371 RepID=UPI0039058827
MKIITINCRNIMTETQFWRCYLQFADVDGAEYFGRNLDAFSDALQGGPGWPGECELHFTETGHIRLWQQGHFYQALKDIALRSSSIRVVVE